MASILIVDDHVLNRKFLSAMLGFEQHRLLLAADGFEGLALARQERPDLIITDIMMPAMDGHAFARAVRADPDIGATPIIFYTSTYSTGEVRRMAADSGVRWLLQKPAAPELILHTVREALGLPQAPAQAPAPDLAALQDVGLGLSALIDMGIKMTQERDPGALLDYACKVGRQIGVARYAVLGIVTDDGNALRHLVCQGLADEEAEALSCMAPGAGVLGKVLRERRSVRLRDLDGSAAAAGFDGAHPPMFSLLAVPVASAARCYGWLYLADRLGAPEFSEIDERAVATVGTQLAVAFENQQLVERIQDDVDLLEEELRERAQVNEQLRESESRFRQLADNICEVFFLVEAGTERMLYISPAYEAIWGRSCASLYAQPRSWTQAIHPDDRERVARQRQEWADAPGAVAPFECRYRIVRPDGSVRHIHDRSFSIRDEAGRLSRIAGLAADVSVQHAQEQDLRRLGQLNAVLGGVNAAIVRIRQREALLQEVCRIAMAHGAFSMAWAGTVDPASGVGTVVASSGGPAGYTGQIRFGAHLSGADGARPASVAVREGRQVISEDVAGDPLLADVREELLACGALSVAALPLTVDQKTCGVLALFADEPGFFQQQGRRALLDQLGADLSFGLAFIAREERLQYLAYYDAVTGLPNRALFVERLAALLDGPRQDGAGVAVAVIDIEHFARLNDALGRGTGDALLRRFGQVLENRLGPSCCAARLDSDSYVAMLTAPAGAPDETMARLEARVLPLLDQDLAMQGLPLRVSARAGIALARAGEDPEALLRHAAIALQHAKEGGERCLAFDMHMNDTSQARMLLEEALRTVLEKEQLSVHFQARVDLASGRIASAEALLRWHHPERGAISPADFVPVAEQTGLIVPIGVWVIDTVCAQQAQWKQQGLRVVPVAINLSAVQFKRGRVQDTIRAALERHQLAPQDIEFELTESVVMENPEQAALDLQELKALGVKLSLDDFGTGYSSLAYLKRFPFDFVKIDRSFVAEVTRSAEDAAIATAIIGMAHSLGLRVVAEGVETEGQLQFLRRRRCDEMQGYYFSRPVGAADYAALLREDRRLPLTPEEVQQEGTLLIVDDEDINLMALRRLLRQEGYRVLTARSGDEALELLALNPVQVVLSDQRMPGMSGAQLLALVKELYPDAIRMMLSAATDFGAVADSVNQGAVYKYLNKPWDGEALRRHLRDAFREQRVQASRSGAPQMSK